MAGDPPPPPTSPPHPRQTHDARRTPALHLPCPAPLPTAAAYNALSRCCRCAVMPPRCPAAVVVPLSALCGSSPAAPPRCTTSCRRPHPHAHPHPSSPRPPPLFALAPDALHARSYAQHASPAPDLSWPDAVHPQTTPTPYQILHCRRGDVYSKHRFYALVKLYHPDRADPASPVAHLPRAVRLERYRLLVAAHAILVDDAKRRAYDVYGHGWHVVHRAPSPPAAAAASWAPEQRPWPPGHDPIHNATWEDWERWYQREGGPHAGGPHAGAEPRDVQATNLAFVALVFALVSLGGIVQGTRASVLSSSVMEQRDRVHREASIELRRSKHATLAGDRDERIRTFVEHREAVNAGEHTYQRLLPPAETCAPEPVRK